MRSREVNEHFGQFEASELAWIAEFNRPDEALGGAHQPKDSVNQVAREAEAPSLALVKIERDGSSFERLHPRVRAALVVWVRTMAGGVEDPRRTDTKPVLAVVNEKALVAAAVAFIVAARRADGIEVAAAVGWFGNGPPVRRSPRGSLPAGS